MPDMDFSGLAEQIANGVMTSSKQYVNEQGNYIIEDKKNGGFWEVAPDILETLGGIAGSFFFGRNNTQPPPPPPQDNTFDYVMIGLVILLVIVVMILIFKSKK